jgi:hypothetical protein
MMEKAQFFVGLRSFLKYKGELSEWLKKSRIPSGEGVYKGNFIEGSI